MTETKNEHIYCAESDDIEHGYAFWLERLQLWQVDVRCTLMAITQAQSALLEHEEIVCKQFAEFRALEGLPDCDPEESKACESQLRGYYHRARRRQESLQHALTLVLQEYAAIEPVPAMPAVFERTSPLKDKVGEASWESFPASDPPSSNPG